MKPLSGAGSKISNTGFPVTRFDHNDCLDHIAAVRPGLIGWLEEGAAHAKQWRRRVSGSEVAETVFEIGDRTVAVFLILTSWNSTDLSPAPTGTQCLRLSKSRPPWLPNSGPTTPSGRTRTRVQRVTQTIGHRPLYTALGPTFS